MSGFFFVLGRVWAFLMQKKVQFGNSLFAVSNFAWEGGKQQPVYGIVALVKQGYEVGKPGRQDKVVHKVKLHIMKLPCRSLRSFVHSVSTYNDLRISGEKE